MAVGFGSYDIARSGMFVNERGLHVTGHNISNVNTPGYVRQQAVIDDKFYVKVHGKFEIGVGADIQQIRQIRYSFLDNIYRQENTCLGQWNAKAKTFEDIQSILVEPVEEGLQNLMNQFWNSWHELAKEPNSLTARALVRQRGEVLANHINHVGSRLDKLQDDINNEINIRIDEVNNTLKGLAQLNVEVLRAEVDGDRANDLRDKRNLLLDKLSGLVDVSISEMLDGQVAVMSGGYFLLNKGDYSKLYAAKGKEPSSFYTPMIENLNVEIPLKDGRIKGLMESRGMVSGAAGSIENGTPNTKTDIAVVIDVSSGADGYIDNIKDNIECLVKEADDLGLDCNFRLMAYDDSLVVNENYGSDMDGFISAVENLSSTASSSAIFNTVADALGNAEDFRDNSNRYAFVFTGESPGGDGNVLPDEQLEYYADVLGGRGIKTSVFTDSDYFSSGDIGEKGWSSLADATGGDMYDIFTSNEEYEQLMKSAGEKTGEDVNKEMCFIDTSTDIIPVLKKKLNSFINILARQINYFHKNGKTLKGAMGEDFFTVKDNSYPLEMGNIKLNENLADLNNIVASDSGSSGDNQVALKIANLRNSDIMQDETGVLNPDDYYQTLIMDIGHKSYDTVKIAESQKTLVDSARAHRESVTGVSLDEEMTNMMKYKYAYNASSRIINTVDKMIDTIISRMGITGR